ncbi:MAG: hypothetical protein NT154_06835 [Verrucomicrobia bacterium]|nr:hypothetical protein [Verrucomicrobiota bacterium]
MAVAERLGQTPALAELRGQRGTAWVKCGKWAEAKPDPETALEELPPENPCRRAELLSSLAAACFWALDIPGMQRHATEGHALAEKAGRDDLVAALLGWLGASQQTLGDLDTATELYEQALAQGTGFCSAGLAGYPLTLHLRGRTAEALDRARESAQNFRSLSDTFAATFGHPHLGLVLAACGRYTEAASVFEVARQLRLRQARAELACARRDWAGALEAALAAISESQARGRTKYVVMALETRSRALAALGRKQEAISDARNALQLARPVGDPALFLRAATTLLALDGDDVFLLETRKTAGRILAELPDDEMRRHFETAEPVHFLAPLPLSRAS